MTIKTTILNDLLILDSIEENGFGKPGTLLDVTNSAPLIACGNKTLRLLWIKSNINKEIDWNMVFVNKS